MRRSKWVGALVAVASMAAVMSVPAVAEATEAETGASVPPLLEVGAEAPTSSAQVEDAREADVDTSLLRPGVEQTVSIDVLETDVAVDLEPIDSGVAGWAAWTGDVVGEPTSSVTFVRKADDVAGLISMPEGTYRVRTTAPGEQVVQVIDGTFVESTEDHLEPPATMDLGLDPQASGDATEAPPVASDDPPIIDVLVGYTPAALTLAGSQSAMNSEIALAISATNTAYANSGVLGRVRLVGSTALTENLDLSTQSLDWLTGTSDGHSDQIHALRNSTGADLVSVLTDDATSCGLGWLLNGTTNAASRSAYGFSTVDYRCAVDNLSFPHELGHNMGLDHDRYVKPTPTLYPYSLGYVNLVGRWRTIMAYNNQCAAQSPAFNCTRIGRFSNPDLTYNGAPTGRPITGPEPADSRLALNTTHPFVASFRGVPTAPTIGTATPGSGQVTVTWTAPTSNGGAAITGYTVTPYVGATAQTPRTFASTATSQAVTGLTNGTTYTFRVAATNANGTGPQSTASSSATPATTPGAPTIGSATAGDGQATVTWSAPSSNGGSAITGYRVTPYIGASAQPAQTFASTATTQIVTGLTNGTSYAFRVAAINDRGVGANSSLSNAVTPARATPEPPTITAQRSPAPNAAGWNNTPVTVTFTCTSTALASCTGPVTLSNDGAGQTVTGTVVDTANQSNQVTVSGIDIDRTAPSITASVTGTSNGAGGYWGPVTVTWDCQDALSGIADGGCPDDVTVSSVGTHPIVGEVSDRAGNLSSGTVSVRIDPQPVGLVGRVTSATGDPIAGIQVRAYRTGTTTSSAATTDADGRYAFPNAGAGEYRLWFRDLTNTSWISEYHHDAATLAEATPVTLSAGGFTVTDATLASKLPPPASGTISGTVRSSVGSAPIAGIQVRLYSAADGYVKSAATTTDQNGAYSFTNRPAGGYRLWFRDISGASWISEYHLDASSLATATTVNHTGTSTINAVLVPKVAVTSGTITGTVRSTVDSAPIAGIQVRLYSATDGFAKSAATTTDQNGVYSFTNRPAGGYKLWFRDLSGTTWISEYHLDASSLATATTANHAAAITTIDAALAPKST